MKKMRNLFLGYRNGNCGRGPVFMWIFILFPDRFFCFVADWPPRLLFFIFWFQNAQKLWSNSLSSSSVPQRKHDSVSKSVSFHQKRSFFVKKWWFLVLKCPFLRLIDCYHDQFNGHFRLKILFLRENDHFWFQSQFLRDIMIIFDLNILIFDQSSFTRFWTRKWTKMIVYFSEDESTAVSIIRGSSISSPIAPPSGYKLLGHVINTDKNLEYYINNEDDIQLKLLPRE